MTTLVYLPLHVRICCNDYLMRWSVVALLEPVWCFSAAGGDTLHCLSLSLVYWLCNVMFANIACLMFGSHFYKLGVGLAPLSVCGRCWLTRAGLAWRCRDTNTLTATSSQAYVQNTAFMTPHYYSTDGYSALAVSGDFPSDPNNFANYPVCSSLA